MRTKSLGFWMMQGPGWFLLLYLIYAQAIPAFNYELGVAMATQEPAERITQVGVAFWYGFALADLLVYIPLLTAGLIGHAGGYRRGRLLLIPGLAITLYWPVVCLAALVVARDAPGWQLSAEGPYWVVLPLIALWGAWGLWRQVADFEQG